MHNSEERIRERYAAYLAGYKAFNEMIGRHHNPHKNTNDLDLFEDWERGYIAAQKQAAEPQSPGRRCP